LCAGGNRPMTQALHGAGWKGSGVSPKAKGRGAKNASCTGSEQSDEAEAILERPGSLAAARQRKTRSFVRSGDDRLDEPWYAGLYVGICCPPGSAHWLGTMVVASRAGGGDGQRSGSVSRRATEAEGIVNCWHGPCDLILPDDERDIEL